jgi:hypothetical protein
VLRFFPSSTGSNSVSGRDAASLVASMSVAAMAGYAKPAWSRFDRDIAVTIDERMFRQGRPDDLSMLTAPQPSFDARQALILPGLERQPTRVAPYEALDGPWGQGDSRVRGGHE